MSQLQRGRVADQIVDDLRRQILGGELPDGSQLPSERELAARYRVSPPTIREAIRVLTAMGLLNARSGNRTTVTANADALLRMSMASYVQCEKVPTDDILGMLGALNVHAVELAVVRATDDDLALLRAACAAAENPPDTRAAADALRRFFAALVTISHNALLAAVSMNIAEIQMGIAVELSGGEAGKLADVVRALHPGRVAIVDAIADHDAEAAAARVRDYHHAVIELIRNLPHTKQVRETDPDLTGLMATWFSTNIRLSA